MNTPICDFVKKYVKDKPCRLHVPGHKGYGFLGVEKYDLTEIDGADDLQAPEGIILESEKNASKLFGYPTFYTTEGSSHAIRAMVYLAKRYALKKGLSQTIIATRNVHKSFLSATALLGIDVDFIKGEEGSYLSSNLSLSLLDKYLKNLKELPCALYVTSPDYLGNLADVKGLKRVCEKYGILLLVDNAHGAYLKFLENSLFPLDLGADMCASSAHKTLPVLTGGAYLQLANSLFNEIGSEAKTALSLFGSTSPSYLILQSLDYANRLIEKDFREELKFVCEKIKDLCEKLNEIGLLARQNEPLKLTILSKSYGYTGIELKEILYKNKVVPEFYDKDFVVLSFSANTPFSTFKVLEKVLKNVEKREPIKIVAPKITSTVKVKDLTALLQLDTEIIDVDSAENRVYAELNLHCPPAVPLIIAGELITKEVIEALNYYGIKTVKVIK